MNGGSWEQAINLSEEAEAEPHWGGIKGKLKAEAEEENEWHQH